jgi:hypothetical protein
MPTLAGVANLGDDFVLQLDPSGTEARKLFRFPRGAVTAPPAFNASGSLLLLGSQNALLTLPPSYAFDSPAIVAFANSASYALNTGLYPGALMTLYGFDLPASTKDVQVLVDGTPAPLLYAGPNQINLQVPFEVSTLYLAVHTLEAVTPSGSVSIGAPLGQSLGIFTTDGAHAAALNQDGTVNSLSNPAPSGSIVSLFGTGAVWPAGSGDGAAPASAIPWDPSGTRQDSSMACFRSTCSCRRASRRRRAATGSRFTRLRFRAIRYQPMLSWCIRSEAALSRWDRRTAVRLNFSLSGQLASAVSTK